MANCEGCGVQIHFLANKDSGKKMPVEAEPNEQGNLRIDLETGTYRFANDEEYERWKIKPENKTIYPLHISHFARCPNAGKFRKRRKKKNG